MPFPSPEKTTFCNDSGAFVFPDGLGDSGSQGRAVFGVSDFSFRENPAGEDPQDL
jgi:hypothetical protein